MTLSCRLDQPYRSFNRHLSSFPLFGDANGTNSKVITHLVCFSVRIDAFPRLSTLRLFVCLLIALTLFLVVRASWSLQLPSLVRSFFAAHLHKNPLPSSPCISSFLLLFSFSSKPQAFSLIESYPLISIEVPVPPRLFLHLIF
jgi:hypothetical protein